MATTNYGIVVNEWLRDYVKLHLGKSKEEILRHERLNKLRQIDGKPLLDLNDKKYKI